MPTPHPGWLDDPIPYRAAMVRDLAARGAVRSRRVRAAFEETPRELFVPGHALLEGVASVYRNEVLVTMTDPAGTAVSSSSQPQLMAAMLENLDVHPGAAVLEVGTGTGYNAALLRRLVGPEGAVASVEVDPAAADAAREALRLGGYEVEVVVGDGARGHPPRAPYDRVIVTASRDAVPLAWVEQLGEGGLLEVPLRLNGGESQAVVTFERRDGRLRTRTVLSGRFMPMRGAGEVGRRDQAVAVGPAGAEVRLAGASTSRLSTSARARLDAALGHERVWSSGVVAPTWDLVMFVSLEVPSGVLVSRWPELSVGVLDPDGGGLALVLGSRVEGDAPREQQVVSYGRPDAEQRLLEVVRRWVSAGRPGVADLVVDVDPVDGSVSHGWRDTARSGH